MHNILYKKNIYSDNITENLEKFERFQQKHEEEYQRLTYQLEVNYQEGRGHWTGKFLISKVSKKRILSK